MVSRRLASEFDSTPSCVRLSYLLLPVYAQPVYLLKRATGGIRLTATRSAIVQLPTQQQRGGRGQQQISPYFNPTYTRTGWIGQPPVLDRHEVVTVNGDVDTLRQATP